MVPLYMLMLLTTGTAYEEPTYTPETEPVETVTEITEDELSSPETQSSEPEVVSPAKVEAVSSRLVRTQALPGENQEVINAILEWFPEEPLMVEIARCESGLDPSADRITHDGRTGIDGGLFQINQVHLPRLDELELDRYDLQDNLQFARVLYDESGTQPWFMSEHCWERFVT